MSKYFYYENIKLGFICKTQMDDYQSIADYYTISTRKQYHNQQKLRRIKERLWR